jgi:hypothetical protein
MPPPNLYACVHTLVATIARKTAGAARTRSSLRPLISEGKVFSKARANHAARILSRIQLSSPRRRVIPYSRERSDEFDRPQRTGYPAYAGYDEGWELRSLLRHCEERSDEAIQLSVMP